MISCIHTGDGFSVRAQPNYAFPELWKDVSTSESHFLLIKGRKQFPTMSEEGTFFRDLGFLMYCLEADLLCALRRHHRTSAEGPTGTSAVPH